MPLADDEQEVTFTSQGDTLYGTLLIPKNATGKMSVALLLSGLTKQQQEQLDDAMYTLLRSLKQRDL